MPALPAPPRRSKAFSAPARSAKGASCRVRYLKVRKHFRNRRTQRQWLHHQRANAEARPWIVQHRTEFRDHIGRAKNLPIGSDRQFPERKPRIGFREAVQFAHKMGTGGRRERRRVAIGKYTVRVRLDELIGVFRKVNRKPGVKAAEFASWITVDADQSHEPPKRQSASDPSRQEFRRKEFRCCAMRVINCFGFSPCIKDSATERGLH